MEKVLVLEISIDFEKKETHNRIGYNKSDFCEDDMIVIQEIGKEFCRMVGSAYMHKFEQKKEDA